MWLIILSYEFEFRAAIDNLIVSFLRICRRKCGTGLLFTTLDETDIWLSLISHKSVHTAKFYFYVSLKQGIKKIFK